MIIGERRIADVVKVTRMDQYVVELDTRVPAILPGGNPLVTAQVVLEAPAVFKVLLPGDDTQVRPAIVQLVVVDMIDLRAVRRLHDLAVHSDSRFTAIARERTDDIAPVVEPSAVL